ncbi:MAG TPA: Spy/CpxP family protein refolding chaperone [Vulgatibacter sp.]
MTPKKFRTPLAIAALGAAAFLALTGFRHAKGGPEEWMNARLDRLMTAIDATPDQRSRIEAIRDELMASRPARGGEKAELLAIFSQEEPDAAAVHARIGKAFDERRAFADRVADALIEVHGILTPEQREKVSKLIAEKSQRGHRRGAAKSGK